MNTFTVSEINELIKDILVENFQDQKAISVTGEISNLKVSGRNTFLTLKDQGGSISAVFWGKNLNQVKNGDNVEISGKLDYYVKSGNVNFIGYNIQNLGIGELHKEYEKVFKRYEKLGYFNNKKDLPESVKSVGVVTAREGAALQDFLYVLNKNNFKGQIRIYNSAVQGINCPKTVKEGIEYFNNHDNEGNKVDMIIVTRGGGSFEDLMGFSHPLIIEAINKSKIYTISAIGHEVDNMISDYAANYRAPTPSIAGEVLSNIFSRNQERILKIQRELDMKVQYMQHELLKYSHKVETLSSRVIDPHRLIQNKILDLEEKVQGRLLPKLKMLRDRVSLLGSKLDSYNPDFMLSQGFTLLTTLEGEIIYDINKCIDSNEPIMITHSKGSNKIYLSKYGKISENKNPFKKKLF